MSASSWRLMHAPLPTFHYAQLGPITQDYPDLVLAAVVGGILAGRALQRPAAVLVAILSAAYTALLTIADMLPPTVPLTLVLVLLELGPGLHDSRRGIRSRPEVAVAVGPRLALRARPLAESSPRSSRPRQLPCRTRPRSDMNQNRRVIYTAEAHVTG